MTLSRGAALLGMVAETVSGCGRHGFDAIANRDAQASSVDASSAAAYDGLVLGDGPRAYYRFGESAGPIVFDSSGNSNDADTRVSGVLSFGQAGALTRDPDPAIYLSGAGNAGGGTEAAVVFRAVWPTWSGDFTIEAFLWPRTPPAGYNGAFVICETHMVNGFRTGWTGNLRLEMWSTQGGDTGQLLAPTPLVAGAWNHVAIARQSATVTMFVNGSLVAMGDVPMQAPQAGASCGAGAFHGMASEANLDELAIYDRALTAAEIAAHAAAR